MNNSKARHYSVPRLLAHLGKAMEEEDRARTFCWQHARNGLKARAKNQGDIATEWSEKAMLLRAELRRRKWQP
jgi:hypothetical protein